MPVAVQDYYAFHQGVQKTYFKVWFSPPVFLIRYFTVNVLFAIGGTG
jgi:hypothetical protein